MGKKTIEGYAVSEGAPPDSLMPFPHYQAATLVSTADSVNVPGVREVVDLIKELIGDPTATEVIRANWVDATDHLTSAAKGEDGLERARENLEGIWEGGGAEAAAKYVNRLVASTLSIREQISKIDLEMGELTRKIIQAYVDATNNIIEYGEKILDLAGGLLGNESFTPIGIAGEIIGLLSEFLGVTRTVIEDIGNYFIGVHSTMSAIQDNAAKIEVPGKIAEVATYDVYWTPKKHR